MFTPFEKVRIAYLGVEGGEGGTYCNNITSHLLEH